MLPEACGSSWDSGADQGKKVHSPEAGPHNKLCGMGLSRVEMSQREMVHRLTARREESTRKGTYCVVALLSSMRGTSVSESSKGQEQLEVL